MALLTDDELSEIRGRHMRAVRGADDEVELGASIAHQDRERLLGAVEQLVPVFEAARLVARMIQRGPLPLAARQALLELHVVLEGVVEAEHTRDAALADALAASWRTSTTRRSIRPRSPAAPVCTTSARWTSTIAATISPGSGSAPDRAARRRGLAAGQRGSMLELPLTSRVTAGLPS